jgi:hypothetical protein
VSRQEMRSNSEKMEAIFPSAMQHEKLNCHLQELESVV